MKKILFGILCFAFISITTVHASSLEEGYFITNGTSKNIDMATYHSSTQSNWDDAVVTDAMSNFKSLSRVERKARVKEVKKYLKEYKANAANATGSNDKVLLAILAIFGPSKTSGAGKVFFIQREFCSFCQRTACSAGKNVKKYFSFNFNFCNSAALYA